MDDFPFHIVVFGIISMVVGPFTYGCAAFLLTYRFSQPIWSKLVFIFLGILAFLWMDSFWPHLAFRDAQIGVAAGNSKVARLLDDGSNIGQAQFRGGDKTSLFGAFSIDPSDIIRAVAIVTGGFWFGMLMTRRKWHETFRASPRVIPPPLPASFVDSPVQRAAPQSDEAYMPK